MIFSMMGNTDKVVFTKETGRLTVTSAIMLPGHIVPTTRYSGLKKPENHFFGGDVGATIQADEKPLCGQVWFWREEMHGTAAAMVATGPAGKMDLLFYQILKTPVRGCCVQRLNVNKKLLNFQQLFNIICRYGYPDFGMKWLSMNWRWISFRSLKMLASTNDLLLFPVWTRQSVHL